MLCHHLRHIKNIANGVMHMTVVLLWLHVICVLGLNAVFLVLKLLVFVVILKFGRHVSFITLNLGFTLVVFFMISVSIQYYMNIMINNCACARHVRARKKYDTMDTNIIVSIFFPNPPPENSGGFGKKLSCHRMASYIRKSGLKAPIF